MTTDAPIPLPKDPRHQRFADLWLRGKGLAEAYMEAGFKCSKKSARAAAARLKKQPDVSAYIAAIQTEAKDETLMTVIEYRRFFARIKRTPITKLDPHQEQDADLIKSFSESATESGTSLRIEKLDPLKAIEMDMRLSGEDPEQNSLKQLAEALAALGGAPPVPTDKM